MIFDKFLNNMASHRSKTALGYTPSVKEGLCTSAQKKMKVLQELEADQKALLRADDESMSGPPAQNKPAPSEMLALIQHAERKLENPGSATRPEK